MFRRLLLASLLAFAGTASAWPVVTKVINVTNNADTMASSTVDLTGIALKNYSAQAVITNTTAIAAALASATDIAHLTGTYTKTNHGFANDEVGQWTTSNALPTGLATSTNYYVINATANTFQVSASLGGASVAISDNGTGTQTFTATTLSGAIKQQVSNDGATWTDVASSSQTFTGTTSLVFSRTPEPFDYARLYLTMTSGAATIAATLSPKFTGAQ